MVAARRGQYEGATPTGVTKTFTLYGHGHDVSYSHLWQPTGPTDSDGVGPGVDHVFVHSRHFERAGM